MQHRPLYDVLVTGPGFWVGAQGDAFVDMLRMHSSHLSVLSYGPKGMAHKSDVWVGQGPAEVCTLLSAASLGVAAVVTTAGAPAEETALKAMHAMQLAMDTAAVSTQPETVADDECQAQAPSSSGSAIREQVTSEVSPATIKRSDSDKECSTTTRSAPTPREKLESLRERALAILLQR